MNVWMKISRRELRKHDLNSEAVKCQHSVPTAHTCTAVALLRSECTSLPRTAQSAALHEAHLRAMAAFSATSTGGTFVRCARPCTCPRLLPRAAVARASDGPVVRGSDGVKTRGGARGKKRTLRALAAAGAWRQLVAAVEERLGEGGSDDRVVAFAASLAADAGKGVVVDALFERMRARGVEAGAHSYSVKLKVLSRARADRDAVDAVVSELTSAGVAMDTVLLNSIAHTYIRAGALGKAHDVTRMAQWSHLRDARTFNILIHGHTVSGDIEHAFQVRNEMCDAGIQPNDVTRNILIDACAKAGDYTRAWELTSEHTSSQSTDALCVAVTSVLVSHAEAGRIAEARALLASMETQHVAPNAVTYAALIRACLRNDAVDAAESIFSSAPDPVRADILVSNALVGGLCRTDKRDLVKRANQLVLGMLRGGTAPNEETFNELIDAYMRAANFVCAEKIVDLMRRSGVQPTVVSYSMLIRGYGAKGRGVQSRKAFARMLDDGIRPDSVALNTLIAASCRCGELDFALSVLRSMEKETGARRVTCSSYAPLISAYSRGQNFEAVWSMYQRIKKNGLQPNMYISSLLMSAIHVHGNYVVRHGRLRQRDLLAKRCCTLLQDGVDACHDTRKLRKWRRQLLTMFGLKKQLVRELEKLKLNVDVTSASERIFEKHGWNDIDSGWQVL